MTRRVKSRARPYVILPLGTKNPGNAGQNLHSLICSTILCRLIAFVLCSSLMEYSDISGLRVVLITNCQRNSRLASVGIYSVSLIPTLLRVFIVPTTYFYKFCLLIIRSLKLSLNYYGDKSIL